MTPTAAAQPVAETVFHLPLAQIAPSPSNPRRSMDETLLAGLAASIASSGVREPIVVRPRNLKDWDEAAGFVSPQSYKSGYEIVFGERRWRASQIAKRETIPAIVRCLTNAQALEDAILENLQREDVSTIDEAHGYQKLLDKPASMTVELLAQRLGKSVGFIYGRLKLTQLADLPRQALEKGWITPAHGVLIARLTPFDQDRALKKLLDPHEHSGKKTPVAKVFEDQIEREKYDLEEPEYAEELDRRMLSEKALREWIQENVRLDLKKAPFDIGDPNLVPAAGSCNGCIKNTSTSPERFSDLVEKPQADQCLDGQCYNGKVKALVQIKTYKPTKSQREGQYADSFPEPAIKLSTRNSFKRFDYPGVGPYPTLKAGQWLEAKKGSCASVRKGIFVDGEQAGTEILVCPDQSCKKHKHPSERGAGHGGYDHAAERAKRVEQEERNKKHAQRERKLRRLIFTAITEKVADFGVQEMRMACHTALEGVHGWNDPLGPVLDAHGWEAKGKTREAQQKVIREQIDSMRSATLGRLLVELSIVNDVEVSEWDAPDWQVKERKGLQDVADAYKVDAAKIIREFEAGEKKAAGEAKPKTKAAKAGK